MTQAKVRFASFEEYLVWSDAPENYLEGRYELVDGELVELMPESGRNLAIARFVFFMLVAAGIPLEFVMQGGIEVQVPVLQTGDAANRFPDLLVLREEHPALIEKRATITREMPPPRMLVEVVSPGNRNQERDYNRKLSQYQAIGVDEYWIADPTREMVSVFILKQNNYRKVGEFRSSDIVPCLTCLELRLTAEQILSGGHK
ncbi:MAG: Uma2 family endonuclease [Oculatellaceae cyanobacterium Prado106]|jgi:Uma2 family endonuclease|nr:Uma2 family endonuclease [Oculatellaceae cyanobacterium Prado106]